MKQKIIDLFDEVECSSLNFDELIEMEIDHLVQGIDLKRVEKLAISNRENNINKPLTMKKRKKINKWLLCAVLATTLISGTLLAKQYMSKFNYFLGENVVIPVDDLVYMDNTQSVDEINMEIKEAMVNGNTISLIMSFTRKDGGQFDDTVRVGDMLARWDADIGGSIEYRLVEDNTELLCLYKMHGSHAVETEQIEITAQGLYERETVEEEINIPLDTLYKKYPIKINPEKGPLNRDIIAQKLEEYLHKQMKKYPIELPLESEYPSIKFGGVSFVDGELVLTLHSYWTESEKELGEEKSARTEAQITKVRDIRNNKVYEANTGYGYLEEDTLGTLYFSQFDELKEEDLPYLRPIIQYNIVKPLTDKRWQHQIIVEGGGKGFSKNLSESKQYKIGHIQLQEVQLSNAGVMLIGKTTEDNKDVLEEPIIKLLTKDNQLMTLENVYSGNSGGEVVWRYERSDSPLIDTKNIAKLSINDWVIAVQDSEMIIGD